MKAFLTLGGDGELEQRRRRLQETRLARIREMRRIDQERRAEMLRWYRQEARQQQSDLKEHLARARQAEQQGALLRRALEEQAWAAAPGARDEAECAAGRAREAARARQRLQERRRLSQKQRAQEALDALARERAEEGARRAERLERYERFAVQENARRQQAIDAQRFRERERKKYFLEEQLYKESLEYKLRERQGAVYTEVVKQDQVPLLVNRSCRRPLVEVIPERAGDNPNMSGLYSADAYVEAAHQAQNPPVRAYPEFDHARHRERQRVDGLAAEGMTILEAISKM